MPSVTQHEQKSVIHAISYKKSNISIDVCPAVVVSIVVSIVDDNPKPKDPMPKHFREMERHGLKITSWEERV
jgi:hypothetical protein